MRHFVSVCAFTVLAFASVDCLLAQEAAGVADAKEKKSTVKGEDITLGGGSVKLTAPASWKKKKPRSRILAYEFSIPAGDKDLRDGRFTVSTMRGSVKANIDRWVKQFPKATNKKVEEKKVGEQVVHLVDLTGTFMDSRGPAFPAVERDDYRMLGAIIPTKENGQHFLKFYGPSKVIDKQSKAFEKMIQSMKLPSKK